ncbi:hypothetical protein [Pseudoxanthomonas mexicana]|uniref:hypothetical protein n=1 Tax=Pseudoxanthomonas mexicana TaxID=128785 RepID=UPI0028AEFEA9|nr:hypothetical protein [Pseudoxanthomonas mexicana]
MQRKARYSAILAGSLIWQGINAEPRVDTPRAAAFGIDALYGMEIPFTIFGEYVNQVGSHHQTTDKRHDGFIMSLLGAR